MSTFKEDQRFESIIEALEDDASLAGTLPPALRLQLSNYVYRKEAHERGDGHAFLNAEIRRQARTPKPPSQHADVRDMLGDGAESIPPSNAAMNAEIRREAGRRDVTEAIRRAEGDSTGGGDLRDPAGAPERRRRAEEQRDAERRADERRRNPPNMNAIIRDAANQKRGTLDSDNLFPKSNSKGEDR